MKLLSLAIALIPIVLPAQNIQTFSLTNTGGVYNVLSNPANAAASQDWLSINLAGAGIGMENNIIRTDLRYSIWQIVTLKHKRDERSHFGPPYFEVPGNAPKNPGFYLNARVLLPSVKINITPKISAFLYMGERVVGNVVEAGKDLFPLLLNDKIPYNSKSPQFETDVRLMAYREVGAGFAAQLYERNENMVKAGITLKKLTARFAYIVSTQYYTASQSFDELNVLARYRVMNTDLNALNQNPSDYALVTKHPGEGFGADVGFVYEHRPRFLKHRYRITNPKGKNKNFRQRDIIKYDLRIAASLLDWGSIDFMHESVSDKVFEAQSHVDLKNAPLPEKYKEDLTKNSEVVYERKKTRLYLPATTFINADYRINSKWYLNVSYSQNMRSAKKAENFYAPSAISALIRKEMPHVTYGVPLRIVPRTRTFTVGWITKAGPFFAGTDNFLTFFSRKMYNWSMYAGLCFTIKYKKDPTIETFKNFGQF